MHGTEQMMEDYQKCKRLVEELEKQNQELDRDFINLTDAYAGIYAALESLDRAIRDVLQIIGSQSIGDFTVRSELDLALAQARRLLGTHQPKVVPYPICHKSQWCARPEGHEGECD